MLGLGGRKNSDDDYFVEETLLFTLNPERIVTDSDSPPQTKKGSVAQTKESLVDLVQPVDVLRKTLLIEVHHCCK